MREVFWEVGIFLLPDKEGVETIGKLGRTQVAVRNHSAECCVPLLPPLSSLLKVLQSPPCKPRPIPSCCVIDQQVSLNTFLRLLKGEVRQSCPEVSRENSQ